MDKQHKCKKILLPLDGSDRSLGAVRYVTKIKPFHQMQIVLFHVYAGYPESYFDLEKDPRSTGTVAYVRAWEIEQKKKARDYMEKAKREDYGTIVLGRRGLSQVRTFFIGRVTNKVIHLARDRTVWVMR